MHLRYLLIGFIFINFYAYGGDILSVPKIDLNTALTVHDKSTKQGEVSRPITINTVEYTLKAFIMPVSVDAHGVGPAVIDIDNHPNLEESILTFEDNILFHHTDDSKWICDPAETSIFKSGGVFIQGEAPFQIGGKYSILILELLDPLPDYPLYDGLGIPMMPMEALELPAFNPMGPTFGLPPS